MAMTLGELREKLERIPKEYDGCLVVLQKDAEGNGYSPLAGVDEDTIYVPDSTWSGDVYSLHWTAEDADMTEEEWEEFKVGGDRAVVFYPVN